MILKELGADRSYRALCHLIGVDFVAGEDAGILLTVALTMELLFLAQRRGSLLVR